MKQTKRSRYGPSLTPLEPRRTMPKWFGKRPDGTPLPDDRKRYRVTTDDAVVELCLMTQSHQDKGKRMLAYQRAGLWQMCSVDARRITQVETLLI
jgi:hypothetical protein